LKNKHQPTGHVTEKGKKKGKSKKGSEEERRKGASQWSYISEII
jgi:hypothetical protein